MWKNKGPQCAGAHDAGHKCVEFYQCEEVKDNKFFRDIITIVAIEQRCKETRIQKVGDRDNLKACG